MFCSSGSKHKQIIVFNKILTSGGGSMIVWSGISLSGKTRLAIFGGNLKAKRYQDEILEDLANFSWVQCTYSALLLIPQMCVPYKCGTI
uniref:Uncharacterized protein n=1 Tax=Echeneis naucrates TaxID=173247 RepID=A0A665XCB4_ECHNA